MHVSAARHHSAQIHCTAQHPCTCLECSLGLMLGTSSTASSAWDSVPKRERRGSAVSRQLASDSLGLYVCKSNTSQASRLAAHLTRSLSWSQLHTPRCAVPIASMAPPAAVGDLAPAGLPCAAWHPSRDTSWW